MATLNVKIVVLDTHDINTISVTDASTYTGTVTNPTLTAQAPGYNPVILPFTVGGHNVLTSNVLGITGPDIISALPDGIYHFEYSFDPSFENFDKLDYMRVDKLLEKYYSVFMQLDMMECNQAIKTQAKVDLSSIMLMIHGSMAAASNCAYVQANELYDQANKMLNRMINHNCGCTGSQYIINYK